MRNVLLHTDKIKKRSSLFFEIGMIVALSVVLWAFNFSARKPAVEFSSYEDPFENTWEPMLNEPEIEREQPVNLTPPNPQKQQPTGTITVVPNHVNVPEPVAVSKPKTLAQGLFKGISKPKGPTLIMNPNDVVDVPSKQPVFPGGEKAMLDFVRNNYNYPVDAVEVGIEGRVMMSFIIEKDGSISNITALTELGWGLEQEAIKMIKKMPRWQPGENKNRPVRVRVVLPIKLELYK